MPIHFPHSTTRITVKIPGASDWYWSARCSHRQIWSAQVDSFYSLFCCISFCYPHHCETWRIGSIRHQRPLLGCFFKPVPQKNIVGPIASRIPVPSTSRTRFSDLGQQRFFLQETCSTENVRPITSRTRREDFKSASFYQNACPRFQMGTKSMKSQNNLKPSRLSMTEISRCWPMHGTEPMIPDTCKNCDFSAYPGSF